MTSRHSGTVGIAFEMLLEAIDKEIRAVMENGVRAFQSHEFQKAVAASQRADLLKKFRERVEAISQEWEALARVTEKRDTKNQASPVRTQKPHRLPKGARTPEAAFYLPILRVLDEMGGSGKVRMVLDRINDLIAPNLTAADLEALPNRPGVIRWHHTVMWARYNLVQKGLLSSHSPVGTWEITEAGRAYLRDHAPDYPARE